MAKNKNVRIVNRKKNTKRKSYADEKKLSFTPEVKTVIWTCLVVAIVLGVFYLITIKATGGTIFKNDKEDEIDPLIKIAIIHHQFESIHPFFD